MRKPLAVAGLLALLLGLACEPPRSAKPIGTPAKLDPRALGLWSARMDDGDTGYLEIAAHEGGADLLLFASNSDGVMTLHSDAAPADVGGVHYLNLREKRMASGFSDKFELGADYIFVKYGITKSGTLELWYMDDEVAKKAIEAGTLAGTTGPDFVRITDEPPKILEMIAKAKPDDLWVKLAPKFQRVKPGKLPGPAK